MAARYKKVDPRMWDDEKFIELPPMQKLICVYGFTAQSNRIGIFRFSSALAIEHIGIDAETFSKGFDGVCSALNWTFDKRRRVIFLPTWWKYNEPENPNVLQSCLEDLHDVPQTHLISEFIENKQYLRETFHERFSTCCETFAKGYGKHCPNQEHKQEHEHKQEQEHEENSLPSATARRFTTEKSADVIPTVYEWLKKKWHDLYRETHGADYVWDGAKDGTAFAKILALCGIKRETAKKGEAMTVDDRAAIHESNRQPGKRVASIFRAYLADNSAYNTAHPLAKLRSNLNQFAIIVDGGNLYADPTDDSESPSVDPEVVRQTVEIIAAARDKESNGKI